MEILPLQLYDFVPCSTKGTFSFFLNYYEQHDVVRKAYTTNHGTLLKRLITR